MRLYIFRGIPMSGKTTLAKTLPCMLVEADMFFISNGVYLFAMSRHEIAKRQRALLVEQCLRWGCDVAVCGIMASVRETEVLIETGIGHGAEVVVIDCDHIGQTRAGMLAHCLTDEDMERIRAAWKPWPGALSMNEFREIYLNQAQLHG